MTTDLDLGQCGYCKFWGGHPKEWSGRGPCCRYPPVFRTGGQNPGQPHTSRMDECGEFIKRQEATQ